MVLRPTVLTGLAAWYTANSYEASSRQWRDLSGNGNHAIVDGPPDAVYVISNASAASLNSQPYLHGSYESRVYFPPGVLPPVYTLFHIAKWDGTRRGRILTSNGSDVSSIDWYSGFYTAASWAMAGAARHTPPFGYWSMTRYRPVEGWVLSTDQQRLYRSQGVQVSPPEDGMLSDIAVQLTINGYNEFEGLESLWLSDWAMAAMIVYNRELSLAEITAVEDYFSTLYGLPLERALGERDA